MPLQTFLNNLNAFPEAIDFTDTMAVIDALYEFTETAFRNGNLHNAAGQNSGSCKLFAFAKKQQLSQQQTLACFGQYYRNDVLAQPNGDNHQNIRNFMKTGWAGVHFEAEALVDK